MDVEDFKTRLSVLPMDLQRRILVTSILDDNSPQSAEWTDSAMQTILLKLTGIATANYFTFSFARLLGGLVRL